MPLRYDISSLAKIAADAIFAAMRDVDPNVKPSVGAETALQKSHIIYSTIQAVLEDLDARMRLLELLSRNVVQIGIAPSLRHKSLTGRFVHIENNMITALGGREMAYEPNAFVTGVSGSTAALAAPGDLVEFYPGATYNYTGKSIGFAYDNGSVTNVMPSGWTPLLHQVYAWHCIDIVRHPIKAGDKGEGRIITRTGLATFAAP